MKVAKEKADISTGRWFYDASIPFNAVNLIYFQHMFDAVCDIGPSYKAPSIDDIRGHLLKKTLEKVKLYVSKFCNAWKKCGYTLIVDGWTDTCGGTLINFLVYCSKGIIFLKSVDALVVIKITNLLHKLFREVVLMIGPENVVYIVTDNAVNYVVVGRKLE